MGLSHPFSCLKFLFLSFLLVFFSFFLVCIHAFFYSKNAKRFHYCHVLLESSQVSWTLLTWTQFRYFLEKWQFTCSTVILTDVLGCLISPFCITEPRHNIWVTQTFKLIEMKNFYWWSVKTFKSVVPDDRSISLNILSRIFRGHKKRLSIFLSTTRTYFCYFGWNTGNDTTICRWLLIWS